MQRCHWHASPASSQGVHAYQTTAIRSSRPTTVTRKNEMMEPKPQTCMLGPEAQRVVHAFCQCFLNFARAALAMVQPSREMTFCAAGPGGSAPARASAGVAEASAGAETADQ
eukprot:2101862-Pleurochrysis_carterae.AAC.1